MKKEEPVTIIFYIFGDFLFHPFSGLLNYLSNEFETMPKTILVGMNEIPEKPIGQHQREYAHFITHQLIEYFKKNYTLKDDCVLFGHSRATRLVAQVMGENPPSIGNFIFSAPWFSDQQLGELEKSLKEKKRKISVFVTQSEEDLKRNDVKDASEKLTRMLKKYEAMVDTKYKYFEGEMHMSIPPLSFYYGIKAQLRK
jgi:predicted alpha/beta superfamily hydrolase